jgi:hypothetical protein
VPRDPGTRHAAPSVAELTPAGRPGERFGGDGVVALPDDGRPNISASSTAIAPGGRIVVSYPDRLAALNGDGALAPALTTARR